MLSTNFFKVLDVDYDSSNIAKEASLLEDYLLSVGKKFSMEGEEVHICPLARKLKGTVDKWEEQKIGIA